VLIELASELAVLGRFTVWGWPMSQSVLDQTRTDIG
jgi:hypothetical protein